MAELELITNNLLFKTFRTSNKRLGGSNYVFFCCCFQDLVSTIPIGVSPPVDTDRKGINVQDVCVVRQISFVA